MAGAWLGLLVAAWLALLAVSPEAVYLAFPWFFILLHLLPRPVGVTAVGIVIVAAVSGFAWHEKALTVAMVIGPVLGAGVVIATVFGYQALFAESEHRRRLILELDRTRSELSTVQHRAGVMDERERLPARSTTPWPRACPASSCCYGPRPGPLTPSGRSTPPGRSTSSSRPATRRRRTLLRPDGSCGL